MRAFVYMNHHIRDARNLASPTPEPVITVQRGRYRIYCNEVELRGNVRVRFGRLKAHGHDVRAWVEADSVRVIA